MSGGEAAILCPHTKSRAGGRSEVPIEFGLFPGSWLLLSTYSQRDKKICHRLYFSQWQGLAECKQGENEPSKKHLLQENSQRVFVLLV